jgi:CHAD domain-containing protein
LDVSEEGAARLARLPALAAYRTGRAKKPLSKSIVWHDTADFALAEHGLGLSESRGLWRLECLGPQDLPGWLPATPAPVIAEGPSLDFLAAHVPGGAVGAPLLPVAAFEGEVRAWPLLHEGAPAQLAVLHGTVRCVLRDYKICRVIFSGEAGAMANLAMSLAAHTDLHVPRATLATEAISLARGETPPARRLGAPSVLPGSSVAAALGTIVSHLADVILYWSSRIGGTQDPEPVHQMRVAIRRLRSALSVFRRAVREESGWLDALAGELKTLALLLGTARDWDVFLTETGAEVSGAFPGDGRIARMMATGSARRDAAYANLRQNFASPEWRRRALSLALLPTLKPWEAQAELLNTPAATYAASALNRRLKHVLSPGESLDGLGHAALHEIRKQAKQLRYAIEFFSPLFPPKPVRKYLAKLESIQEEFGAFNDMEVAAALAAGLGSGADRAFAAGAVQGFGAAAQARSVRRIQQNWGKFFRAEPFWS